MKDKLMVIAKSKATWAFIGIVLGAVGVSIDPTVVTTIGCALVGGCS